jgi:hypothetical protein
MEGSMKIIFGILSIAALAGCLMLVPSPAAACNVNGNCDHDNHAAPGPIAGAGLPFLAVGYGVYWLVKRRRRTAD